MSADDLRPEAPAPTRGGWLRAVLMMALPLAIVWWLAFSITGILWWSASEEDVPQVPPPEPAHLAEVEADSIDLEAYARAHSSWVP
ncbi:MAG: hypothetical protein U9R79_13145 [Armatimonadota bacterium]|nr:hypothetical protein [Armatimonadota bacterium]